MALGHKFGPAELREILKTSGTPSNDPPNDRIGVMPDLCAILTDDVINLAPDLYLRDKIGDDGNPTSGMVSLSPDIIVRQASVDPETSFGVGSGTENNAALSDEVATGQDNYVYVRLLNRGGTAAANVDVDVYWSPPATLVTPDLWTSIGTLNLPMVPTGNVLTVSNELVWDEADIPGPGHYCFIAVAGNALDPKPNPAIFANFNQYVTYIRNNNNVAWRNFDVIPGPPAAGGSPPGSYRRKFVIPGAADASRRFELEAIGRLPEKSRVILEVPAWLADALKPHRFEIKYDQRRRIAQVPLHPAGTQRIGSLVLHAKSRAECELLVRIPDEALKHPYEFAVRQLYERTEVGRLTWRFGGPVRAKEEKKKARKAKGR
jgi:hypothetical protein